MLRLTCAASLLLVLSCSPTEHSSVSSILVMGDSRAAGAGGLPTLAALVDSELGIPATSIAEGGWLTGHVRNAWFDEGRELDADAVILLADVNDTRGGIPASTSLRNLLEVSTDAVNLGRTVWFASPLPWAGNPLWTPDKQDQTNEIRNVLGASGQALPVWTAFEGATGHLRDEYSRDGTHLSLEGLHTLVRLVGHALTATEQGLALKEPVATHELGWTDD